MTQKKENRMIEMPEDRDGSLTPIGDHAIKGEIEERRFSRGATDLVVSLAANGRSVRLFTADGDTPRSSYYPVDRLENGLEENGRDR
jgi:hypothetical protein